MFGKSTPGAAWPRLRLRTSCISAGTRRCIPSSFPREAGEGESLGSAESGRGCSALGLLASGLDPLLGVPSRALRCLAASLASTHQMPVASPSCHNQKCLQTLPSAPGGGQVCVWGGAGRMCYLYLRTTELRCLFESRLLTCFVPWRSGTRRHFVMKMTCVSILRARRTVPGTLAVVRTHE